MKNAWFVLLCALTGCQVVSGISPLHVDDELAIEEAGRSGMGGKPAAESGGKGGESGEGGHGGQGGGHAGTSGAGGDPETAGSGGAPIVDDCTPDSEAECDWLKDCGCKEDQHCQARGAEAKATCVKKGKRKLGETCKSPDECEQGTCDQKVCRAYCEGDRCDGGMCLPHTGEGDKPIANVKVCWKSCQVQKQEGCVSGTSCQTREVHGTKGPFCVPPADPCPTTQDGVCDEPVSCAPGTDSVDCSCEKPEGQACNTLKQCGCPKDQVCQFDSNNNKPVCGTRNPMPVATGGLCKSNAECAPGNDCIGYPSGSCKRYCDTNADCPGKLDQCKSVVDSKGNDIPGYKICVAGCDASTPCPEHHSCQKQSTGSVCIGFEPDVPGSVCNLTRQMGCENMSGTACVADIAMGKAVCQAHTGMVPAGGNCTTREECESGTDCFLGVCRDYCDPKVRVRNPDQDPAFGCSSKNEVCKSPKKADQSSTPFNMCLQSCTSNSGCPTGQACFNTTDYGTICSKQLTTDCPTNNKRCDEPQGTGICAAGFDTADCMGTP